MITLYNNKLTVSINELGAEIKSIVYCGNEQMWDGRQEIWDGTAPVLFPICGAVKDDKYTYLGKEYHLGQHGFGRTQLFSSVECHADKAVFLLKSSNETKAMYPFDFELYITYTLCETSIKVSYDIKNLTDGDMYFSIGSHEAYLTPEGVEDYDIVFPEKETLSSVLLYQRYLTHDSIPIINNSNVLPIYEKYFMLDSLIFTDLKSRSAILRNRKTGREIKVDFPHANSLLIWHKPNAPYLCVEPWAGAADFIDSDGDLTKKYGIIKLNKSQNYHADHTITF